VFLVSWWCIRKGLSTDDSPAAAVRYGQMGKFLPDPEIDELVQEMNRLVERDAETVGDGSHSIRDLDDPSLRVVDMGEGISELLGEMVRRGASDLILVPGAQPVVRVEGRLERLGGEVVEEGVRSLFAPHLGDRARRSLTDSGSADFSISLSGDDVGTGGVRLRVNIQRQGGRLAAAVRALPQKVPTLAELNLPQNLAELVQPNNGLVLVCGPTGSGKSTTLAAMLDHLNRSQFRHVITIEEPVEYEHRNRQSVFEQIEVGSDSPSFAAALRSALRRDPDVILVGEMRDLETMATAITAAETGHLILSTLHTGDVAQAIHRIVDVYPTAQQAQINQQLSLSLSAIVCQQLVPTADGTGRVPAVEVLLATYAVRNHVRRGNLDRVYNELLGGRSLGMTSMEQSLAELVRANVITADEARVRSSRLDELDRMLAG
jgi:twitching motility protein PilT